MIVTFGNQKGGVGKSTLAIMFANYLSQFKEIKNVQILDLDFQGTVTTKFEKSKNLDNEQAYEVKKYSLEDYPKISDQLKNDKEKITLVDLPGKLDDNNLIPVIADTDFFIIPFEYEQGSYRSTVMFSMISKHINPNATYLYVPNRIRSGVKYDLTEQVDRELKEFGIVLPRIKQLITFERITTKFLTTDQLENVQETFEEIINIIKK